MASVWELNGFRLDAPEGECCVSHQQVGGSLRFPLVGGLDLKGDFRGVVPQTLSVGDVGGGGDFEGVHNSFFCVLYLFYSNIRAKAAQRRAIVTNFP